MLNSVVLYVVLPIVAFLFASFAVAYTSILNFKLTLSFLFGVGYFLFPTGKNMVRELMVTELNKVAKRDISQIVATKDDKIMEIYKLSNKSEAEELKRKAASFLKLAKNNSLISSEDAKKYMKMNNIWQIHGFFYSFLNMYSSPEYQQESMKNQSSKKYSKRELLVKKALLGKKNKVRYVDLLVNSLTEKKIFNISKELREFSVPS